MPLITEEECRSIQSCTTLQSARERLLSFVMRRATNDMLRARLREQVNSKGSTDGLIKMAWDLLLNGEGFGNPALVKTKKGIGYVRR